MKPNPRILSAYPLFVLIKKIRLDQYLIKFTPSELHERFHEMLECFAAPHTIEHYTMVALIDDAILTSQWQFAEAWLAQSLQSIYYSEQSAGQGLLDRLNETIQSKIPDSELEEFLFYCYLWRSESRSTDQLFQALKSRLKLLNDAPPPHAIQKPEQPKKITVKKALIAATGMVLILYSWMQIFTSWQHHRIQEVSSLERQ